MISLTQTLTNTMGILYDKNIETKYKYDNK